MQTTINNLTIRIADVYDAELIADLGARTFVDAYGADNDPNNIERYVAESFSVQQIERELRQPGSVFLLAYDLDLHPRAPIGYARLLEDSIEDGIDGTRPIELVRLYLESWARGRGYGVALMDVCIQEAASRRCETMWLGVWEMKPAARRFYERAGFEAVGTHDFVIGDDRQTDILMVRRIKPT